MSGGVPDGCSPIFLGENPQKYPKVVSRKNICSAAHIRHKKIENREKIRELLPYFKRNGRFPQKIHPNFNFSVPYVCSTANIFM